MDDQVLSLTDVSKSYGITRALQEVTFAARAGEIHALLGENGAGKSTLIKIVTAVLRPDSGAAVVLGQPVPFGQPHEVIARGLSTVYQDLSLVPTLSVAANLAFGSPNGHKTGAWASAVLAQYGLNDIAATDLVEELSFGQRQRLEIVRALSRGPRVLLLDEPTSALSQPEVEWLFELLRDHRSRGVAIVLISHRMGEIRDICDRVTILRNGRNVGTYDAASISDAEIVQLMLGRSLAAAFPERPSSRPPGGPVLQVRGMVVPPVLRDVSFELGTGEVLGLAGLDGQGQRHALRALGGLVHAHHGQVLLDGHQVHLRSPRHAIRHRIALIPSDRAREGLLLPLSVTHNISLPVVGTFARRGLIDEPAERRAVQEMASSLDIAADKAVEPVGALSGGNQQKVLIGKWLMTDARVVMLDDPTQGVDVGTKYEIASHILRLAAQGRGMIVYSSDLDELVHLADRVLVFYQGRVVAELRQPEISAETILAAMTGHAVVGSMVLQ